MIDAGIPKDYVIKYWNLRALQQGKLTVGFAGTPIAEQDKRYKIRSEFIMSHVDTDLATLDYGCGVGRYSKFFDKDRYLGVDITKQLLDIAIEENPEYSYRLLTSPTLGTVLPDIEQFFTATVLQHNTDETVRCIFDSLSRYTLKTIAIYESTMNMHNLANSHMHFRSIDEYYRLVNEYFNIKERVNYTHIIHGSEHSLMIYNLY